jgi:5'-3' exonuclease
MVFYKIHSVITWSKLSKTELTPELFIEKFRASFLKEVKNLSKKYLNGDKNDLMIFALDDCRDNLWRKTIYREYKENRVKNPEHEEFISSAFRDVKTNLIESFLNIRVETAEADDIIAICRRSLPDMYVTILTNDNDFIQLHDDKTVLVNLQGKILTDRIKKEYLSCFTKMRILCGDKSDNIQAIEKNLGEKSAYKYCQEEEKLFDRLNKNEEAMKRYAENKKLISFDEIPKPLQKTIIRKFQKLLLGKIDLKPIQ